MKCKAGDRAKIIRSIRPENHGKEVYVAEYIGKFEKGEMFQFRGMPCVAVISDHYWWITGKLINMFSETPKAYIADSWLEPLRPNNETITSDESVDTSA